MAAYTQGRALDQLLVNSAMATRASPRVHAPRSARSAPGDRGLDSAVPYTVKRLLISLIVITSGAMAPDSSAEPAEDPTQLVFIPPRCAAFWSVPGGPGSPAAWNAALSFAACIQDASIHRIDRADQLDGFVEQLQISLDPAIVFYVAAIEQAPPAIKLRAAYHIGIGQVALITRARTSIASPALREPLEQLLEPHAEIAHMMFSAIERAARNDPRIADDVVTRNMVRSAQSLAALLRRNGAILRDSDELLRLTP
jgi:hypothetical protein